MAWMRQRVIKLVSSTRRIKPIVAITNGPVTSSRSTRAREVKATVAVARTRVVLYSEPLT